MKLSYKYCKPGMSSTQRSVNLFDLKRSSSLLFYSLSVIILIVTVIIIIIALVI